MKQIPLAYNSKKPLAGDDWHRRITDDPDVIDRYLRPAIPGEAM